MSADTMSTERMTAGFGLIELMIAMVLGLIVLGAAFAVFHSNQRSYRSNEGLNRVQEGVRVAHEMMSRDLRASGASACTNEGLVMGTDANSIAFRTPLTGSASQVTTRAAQDESYRVDSTVGASPTSVTLVDVFPTGDPQPSDIFDEGDMIMVCNGAMVGFTTVDSIAGNTVNFTPALEFDPDDTERAAEGSISIARFRNTTWSVGANTRATGNSLYVSRNGGAGEEVADGVQSLAFTYHQYAGGNADAYVSNPPDFAYVDAVRVAFPIRAAAANEVGGTGTTWITRNASTTLGVRSRTP